jgi:hypothetical protein
MLHSPVSKVPDVEAFAWLYHLMADRTVSWVTVSAWPFGGFLLGGHHFEAPHREQYGEYLVEVFQWWPMRWHRRRFT